jgi:HNH endonuclease
VSPRVVSIGPQYSAAPLGRRHIPRPSRPHTEYRDCLRLDFTFRCAYCLSREVEVGRGARYGGFEIEHFKPEHRFRGLRNVYTNLLWACRECNLAKGGRWPSDEEQAIGARFVDAVGGSAAGEYMITEIDLNSDWHVRRRQDREKLAEHHAVLEAICEIAEQEAGSDTANAATLDRLQRVRAELGSIREVLQPATPWDAPAECLFNCGNGSAPPRARKPRTRRERRRKR